MHAQADEVCLHPTSLQQAPVVPDSPHEQYQHRNPSKGQAYPEVNVSRCEMSRRSAMEQRWREGHITGKTVLTSSEEKPMYICAVSETRMGRVYA